MRKLGSGPAFPHELRGRLHAANNGRHAGAVRERVSDAFGRRIKQVLREQRCITANSAADNIDEADVPF